jgi:hypothetical protein
MGCSSAQHLKIDRVFDVSQRLPRPPRVQGQLAAGCGDSHWLVD